MQARRPESLHYSAAASLTRSDFDKVRKILLAALRDAAATIKGSRQERVYALNIDWHELT